LFFFVDNTSSLGQTVVDTAHGIHGGGDFSQEDGFLESGFSSQLASVEQSSGGGDDLTTSSVDGVGVQDTIQQVNSDTSHVFFSHDGFLGGPLPCRFHGILDFVHVLNSLGGIDQSVGTLVFRSEVPELGTTFCLVPVVVILKIFTSDLGVILITDLSVFNFFGKSVSKGNTLSVDSVVLVGGFSHTGLVGFLGDGFSVGNDGFGFNDGALSEVIFQILQTDFDVQFSASGNDVLSRFFSNTKNEGVGFSEFLKSVD